MANRPSRSARADLYTRITTDIIAAIETGAEEWRMPWHHDGSSIARPRNVASDKSYRGINVLALWVAARRAGFASGLWGTYRHWTEYGCQVRKGETAATVVFWKQISGSNRTDAGADHDDISADDEREGRPRFFARGYYVFNEAQVDGRVPPELPRLPESERIAAADAFFSALKIPIISGGNEAFYRPGIDTIFMPPFEHFVDAASYYSCFGHEAAHATGAKHRLDRDLSGRFGSAKYAHGRGHLRAGQQLRHGGPRHRASAALRARGLYRLVAQGPQRRPARHLHRCQQGTAGRRLDARTAAGRGRHRGLGGPT